MAETADKGRLRTMVSTGLLVVCTCAIVWHFVQNPKALARLLNARPWHLGAMLCLHLAILATNTLRLRMVLQKCANQPIPLKPWVELFINGRFLNNVVPQTGNVYRSVELKRRYGVPHTLYVTTLVAVAWLATGLNLLLAALLMLLLDPAFPLGAWPAWQCVLGFLVIVVLGPFLGRAILSPLADAPGKLGWVQRRITEVVQVATDSAKDLSWVAGVMALSAVVFALATANVALCFTALGATPLVGEAALFYVVLQLSNVIKLTPGNLGAQELAFGVLGSQTTVGMSEGILASALFRAGAMMVLAAVAIPLGARSVLANASSRETSDE